MIQFKRGSTRLNSRGETTDGSWSGVILQDGQPGYDKRTNRLKIGDGTSTWDKLKWLKSGLETRQIFDSEASAKARLVFDKEDTTIFTYGTMDPNENLVGQVYFHQYGNGEIEADYVIEQGMWLGDLSNNAEVCSGGYRKWYSGISECWGILKFTTSVETQVTAESKVYKSSYIVNQPVYPYNLFNKIPVETVSLTPASSLSNIPCWLACLEGNSKDRTGKYTILSADKSINSNVTFYLNFTVKGRWHD